MTQRYRTPLRYPGGKQRLAPFIAELMECNGLKGGHYAEPYAGGAGVAMELLLNGMVSHVHLNDASIHIYALWYSIVTHPEVFCRRIASASLSTQEWKLHREVVRHPERHNLLDLGFSTFFLNRCNRSGILTAGVIGGIAQTGRWRMDARFPRNELTQRIEAIATKAGSISVTQMDAEEFMCNHAKTNLPDNTLLYCDPPYYERSKRLYLNSYELKDHIRLAETIQNNIIHKWIVSYDSHPEIIDLYEPRKKFIFDLQYSATRSYKGREVFIFSDNLLVPSHSVVPSVDYALEACGL